MVGSRRIVDISDPAKPRIVANLPIENSIIGPPTNLAITPDNKLALVANSMDVAKDGQPREWLRGDPPDQRLGQFGAGRRVLPPRSRDCGAAEDG